MMERQKKKIDSSSVEWATDRAIESIEWAVKRALNCKNDPEKKERLAASFCISCWYVDGGRIGGAAMTSQPCGICDKEQIYSSTATDVLCSTCAISNELCKQCGADVRLRPRRKFKQLTFVETFDILN